MVLPAPAAHAAPPAGAWLDRLSLVLRLAGRGLLVLVDRARPERLGELTRHVLREYPDAEVLTEAPALGAVREGGVVILCVRAADAGWLNQERPVVQARALRVVLFSDDETTVHLAREAVDFYDWISHRIDCPEGPPAFAVRALRRAACARPPAVVWGGGDLEGTFVQALPGRQLARVSAAQPYAVLVEALAPRPRTWIAVDDLDARIRSQRARWAAAEAGRRGRLVLVDPEDAPSWLPRAHARALAVEDAARRLREAGVEHAVRLAAVLELEPVAIEDAARLARAGMAEAELATSALREDDPGATLARLVRERGPSGAPAEAADVEESGMGARARFRLPDWPARIEMALGAGDPEAATRWAAGWRAAAAGDARATAALARMRVMVGAVDEARTLLDQAHRRAEAGADEDTRFELLRAEGKVLRAEGHSVRALQRLEEALGLARRLGRSLDERSDLYDALLLTFIDMGRLKDAERVFAEWRAALSMSGALPLDPLLVRAFAELKLALGDAQSVSQLLEHALSLWPAPEHPNREVMEHLLARAWIAQERYQEAERLLRGSIERLERLGRRTLHLRVEHGNALFGLGRFQEAEQELRRVLDEKRNWQDAARTVHLLAGTLIAQGRLDEAEATIDGALADLRPEGTAQARQYAMTLFEKGIIRRLRGDLATAAALFREVLRLEEGLYGREHPTLQKTLSALGGALVELEKPREAEPLLRRAVRLAEPASNRLGMATALTVLARAQAAQGFPHARDAAQRALSAWETAGEEPSSALRHELEAIAAGAAGRPAKPPRRHR